MARLDLVAEALIGAVGSAALKAVVILSVASMVAISMRRRSAASRHLVWTVALGATMAVLVLSAVVPAWPIVPVATPSLGVSTSDPAVVGPTSTSSIVEAAANRADGPGALAQSPNRRPEAPVARFAPADVAAFTASHRPSVVLALWVIGVLVVLTRYCCGSAALHRLSGRSKTLRGTACGTLGQQIACEMGIARSVSVLSSDEVELPLAWGIFRPRVVLPADASEWTTERRRHVLQHELAHVKRRDACTQLVAHAASGIFWFHPLVWYARRRMREERERACDDCVLAHGAIASDYASDLLALASTDGPIAHHPVALAMARRSQVEGRLLALLDPTIERGALSRRRVALVLCAGIALVVPTAAMRSATALAKAPPGPLAAPGPPASKAGAESKPPTALAPAIRRHRRPMAADLQDVFAGCASTGSSHEHTGVDAGGATWNVSAQDGDCRFELTSEGTVVFNHDVTAIEGISAGGSIDVTTTVRGDVTRLVARGSSGGAVTYEFSRNGQRAEFSGAGAIWLEQFLIVLDRHTAFAVDRRFPLLLQTGGAMKVLDEIDRMRADHAKRRYLLRLVEAAQLDADALRRAGDAAAQMSSDHDLVEVFLAMASRYGLPDPTVRTMLSSASKMRADHNKVQVLLALAGTQPLARPQRDEYVNVAATIGLDRERRRALVALASGGDR